MDDEVNYSPYFGEILSNGNLRIPTSGRSADGELWDGMMEITPGHSSYALWLSQIKNKAAYHAALAEEVKQARDQRRRLL